MQQTVNPETVCRAQAGIYSSLRSSIHNSNIPMKKTRLISLLMLAFSVVTAPAHAAC
jgi:hypothetical protein